ncbi:hypothetical protein [Bartonella massiliensis]|nr:hypothetical protein [Bartonella massiliensis]
MHDKMAAAATIVLMALVQGALGFFLNNSHCGTVYFFNQAFDILL